MQVNLAKREEIVTLPVLFNMGPMRTIGRKVSILEPSLPPSRSYFFYSQGKDRLSDLMLNCIVGRSLDLFVPVPDLPIDDYSFVLSPVDFPHKMDVLI